MKPKTENNSILVYLVVTANNMNSDLDISEPFFSEAQAIAALKKEYEGARYRQFGDRKPGEFDTDDYSEYAFQVYDSRSNDMEYGRVQEFKIPIVTDNPSPSRISQLADANLDAPDRRSRCRSLSLSLERILEQRENYLHGVRGRKLLTAIKDNDLDTFVKGLTGYDCQDLMNYAHIIRDTTETFSDGPRDARVVYYLGDKRKLATCKVDLRTNHVFDIIPQVDGLFGLDGWFKLEESEEFANATSRFLKLEGFGNFQLVPKEQMKREKDQIVFWFGPEECY